MADKTIKELADELGVSKSYIDKIIRTLKLHTKLDKVGNKYVISKKHEKLIRSRISADNQETESHTKSPTKTHTEVDFLRDQLRAKNQEMATMQKLLDQQQQLTLQSNKQIELLQKKLTRLEEPAQEMSDGSAEEKSSLSSDEHRSFWRRLFKF